MGWIARNLGISGKKNQSSKRHQKSSDSKRPPKSVAHPYRAVTVYSKVSCCAAARRLDGQKFLAAHAPRLPLGGCSQPDTCQCRYNHLVDRRQDTRRDADYGLPGRSYSDSERRNRRDRRRKQQHTLANQS